MKFADTNEKIQEAVVKGYQKMEDGVVEGYKTIEDGVVSGYKKVEDKFIHTFFAKEGETVEEARARLKGEEQA